MGLYPFGSPCFALTQFFCPKPRAKEFKDKVYKGHRLFGCVCLPLQLNHRRFSVATSTRLRKSECVFRFYVYGGIFDNPPGFFYLHVEQVVFVLFFLFFCLDVNSEGRRISFI
jgi:hypothetical protein